MDENRIFKTLWRINAVFIFAAGIFAVFCMFLVGGVLVSDLLGQEAAPPNAEEQVVGADTEELRLSLPYSDRSVGSYIYLELETVSEYGGKFSSGKSSQIRNIAIVDLEANSTKWVFPQNFQEIESYLEIRRSVQTETENNEKETTGFFIEVATSDDNKKVTRDLWIMSPDGEILRKVLSNFSGRFKMKTFGENELRLIIEKADDIDIYQVDVDNLTIGEPVKIVAP
jgi:hypothetical protein